MKCFVCGAFHRFFDCPKWKVLTRFDRQTANIGKLRAQAPTPIGCSDWNVAYLEPSEKEGKTRKGPARYADEDSVTLAQKGRKEKGTYRLHTVCQPDLTDPRWADGPQLQASRQDQVAEAVQGVINLPSLWDVSVDETNILERAAGSTLMNKQWRPADVVLGISSSIGFPTPLVEVATRICGRNVKDLIDCGLMGNYISYSLIPALIMEMVPKQDFEVLELENKPTVKARGYVSF